MISDLIKCIDQDSVRSELLNESFETIICYPGAGADIYPCAVIERIDNDKLGIPNYKEKSLLYIFCDPFFTTDDSVTNSSIYREFIKNLCEKKDLDLNQLLNICKDTGLYGNGYSAYGNISKMLLFTRVNYIFDRKMEGYYYKIVIEGKICHILMLTCDAKELWGILEKYNVNIEGTFLWDVQSWGMKGILESVDKNYLPKWIIGNRPGKYGGCGPHYKTNLYEEETERLICKVRGIEGREEVCIDYLL